MNINKERKDEEELLNPKIKSELYSSSFNEDEDHFYEKNKDELDLIWKITDVCNVITLVGLILFFITLITKTALPEKMFSWFILLIPAIITVISHTITLNLFIRTLDLLLQTHSYFKYILINLTSFSFLTYLVIFCSKMEKVIDSYWMAVSVPLFISLFLITMYLLFILPEYWSWAYVFEIVLGAVYTIGSIVFVYLIHHKYDHYDDPREPSFWACFGPMLVSNIIHLCYSLYYAIFYRGESIMKKTFQIIGTLLSISGFFFMILILEKKTDMKIYYPIGFFLVSVIFLAIFYLYKFLQFEETNNISQSNNINLNGINGGPTKKI